MKKILLIIIAICFCSSGISQENKNEDSDEFLKIFAEKGCKCVDAISTYNKANEKVVEEINECIAKETETYQLGLSMQIDDQKGKSVGKAGKKEPNVVVSTNKKSDDYKKYYYEIERYMMDNCKSLKEKMASSEKQRGKSYSDNPKAKDYYSQGLIEGKKENHEKAIEYFKKALEVDANFAFAWDNIGLSYRKLGDYGKAIESYNKSLELDPKGLMPLQNIAIAYQFKKEYQKAIDSFQKLAEIDKKNPEIYFGIGHVYAVNLNEYEKGLDYMCKAYNMYVEQKSPYRTDAEKIISYIHSEMKKEGKEGKFDEILKVNNISQ
ncbi:MAG TPA: tetratricopeptide repeat protein [Flavobacterium sp.]